MRERKKWMKGRKNGKRRTEIKKWKEEMKIG